MTEAEKQRLLYARQHRQYEKRMYGIFLRALRKQIGPVLNWVSEFGIDPPLEALIKPSVFRQPIKQAYDMVAVTAARREYYYMRGIEDKGFIDFLVEKWRKLFNDYATTYAYRIENELSETTKEEIRRALKDAYDMQLNASDTAGLIRKRVYNEISRRRAVMIARTEATTASNLGKETGAREWLKETNQAGYKQWIGREDERERHTHWELNDDIIQIDEDWQVGNDLAMNPGDTRLSAGNRINCRCTQMFMSARRYERMLRGD